MYKRLCCSPRSLVAAGLLAASLAWACAPEDAARSHGTPVRGDAEAAASVHAMNHRYMQLGWTARLGASSARVRRYGELLFRDHRFVDRRLLDYGRRRGLDLSPAPAASRPEQGRPDEELLQALRSREGRAFDEYFLGAMAARHDHTIGELRAALAGISDEELRDRVADLLPLLEQHRALALELSEDLEAAPGRTGK